MEMLNLPPYTFKLRENGSQTEIFDSFRKKYVVLTPEEWVRQNFLQFLVQERSFPAALIAVEIGLKYNRLNKRADILVYNKQGKPYLLVECKAPIVKISQDTFDQVARYNMAFGVKYMVVTNGINHFCCVMDYENSTYQYIENIPIFE
ncbi:MAG: type I restriction enzyme HsdR N-terminal domain-containing protein [Bacteroidota bacterium]